MSTTTTRAATVTAEPGTAFIDVVRDFDAPADMVFRAHTDPELVQQWLGPAQYTMDLSAWDARPGGSWAYTHSDQHSSHGFRGVFHDVEDGRRIVMTFEYLGVPGHVSLEEARFEALPDGRSRVRTRTVFQSIEARDGMVASGMEGGMQESYRRLDDLLQARR